MKQKTFNLITNPDFCVIIISAIIFIITLIYYIPYLIMGILVKEDSSVIFALVILGSLVALINSVIRMKNASQ